MTVKDKRSPIFTPKKVEKKTPNEKGIDFVSRKLDKSNSDTEAQDKDVFDEPMKKRGERNF